MPFAGATGHSRNGQSGCLESIGPPFLRVCGLRALEGMTGVMDVQVNLRDQHVTIEHLADWIEVSSLTAALRDAGYVAKPVGQDIYTGRNAGNRTNRVASGAFSHPS